MMKQINNIKIIVLHVIIVILPLYTAALTTQVNTTSNTFGGISETVYYSAGDSEYDTDGIVSVKKQHDRNNVIREEIYRYSPATVQEDSIQEIRIMYDDKGRKASVHQEHDLKYTDEISNISTYYRSENETKRLQERYYSYKSIQNDFISRISVEYNNNEVTEKITYYFTPGAVEGRKQAEVFYASDGETVRKKRVLYTQQSINEDGVELLELEYDTNGVITSKIYSFSRIYQILSGYKQWIEQYKNGILRQKKIVFTEQEIAKDGVLYSLVEFKSGNPVSSEMFYSSESIAHDGVLSVKTFYKPTVYKTVKDEYTATEDIDIHSVVEITNHIKHKQVYRYSKASIKADNVKYSEFFFDENEKPDYVCHFMSDDFIRMNKMLRYTVHFNADGKKAWVEYFDQKNRKLKATFFNQRENPKYTEYYTRRGRVKRVEWH